MFPFIKTSYKSHFVKKQTKQKHIHEPFFTLIGQLLERDIWTN